MSNEKISSPAPIPETSQPSSPDENIRSRRPVNRRSFLRRGAIAGAAVGAGLMAKGMPAFAQQANSSTLTKSDIALLRFAAAAAETGTNPALYHLDSTIPGAPRIRTLGQEIARSLRGRAANPRWLQGQMRHGHRGAAEIAQSLDNLYCFAALTDAVSTAQFDLMFDATLGDDTVRAFLVSANHQAACHMAGVFEEAAKRGFWLSRRNSSARILASMLPEAA